MAKGRASRAKQRRLQSGSPGGPQAPGADAAIVDAPILDAASDDAASDDAAIGDAAIDHAATDDARRAGADGAHSPGAPPPAPAGALDRGFAALRLHHVFNAAILFALAAMAYGAPELTLLPLYLALVARVPCVWLQARFKLSFGAAALLVALAAFAVLIATAVALVLPVILQALQLEAESLGAARPLLDDALAGLAAWARGVLASLGVAPEVLDARLDLSAEGLAVLALGGGASDAAALLSALTQALLSPVVLISLAFLIAFMAAYALAASTGLGADARRFIRVCWPPRTVWLIERWIAHLQRFGYEVFRGYSWMVVVLGLFYFATYLGALALFEKAQSLPPMTVVALVILSGIVGAVPGLGAKLLLAVGAVAGLAVGAAAWFLTSSIWLGVYIFAAMVLVTGFESKFGTPMTLGRALGVSSAIMLFVAIATVAAYGIAATLWTVFVILPALAAGMRLMVEVYGEPDIQSVGGGAPPRRRDE